MQSKQLDKETLTELIESMSPGETTFINEPLEPIKHLFHDVDVTINMVGVNFKITKPKVKRQSKMGDIVNILKSYKTGKQFVDFDLAYVRQIVSKYNGRNGDKFKVMQLDGLVHVYKEIEDCEFIHEYQYLGLKDDFDIRLDKMKGKIKPSSFFDPEVGKSQVLESEFPNTEPMKTVTEERLKTESTDSNIIEEDEEMI